MFKLNASGLMMTYIEVLEKVNKSVFWTLETKIKPVFSNYDFLFLHSYYILWENVYLSMCLNKSLFKYEKLKNNYLAGKVITDKWTALFT